MSKEKVRATARMIKAARDLLGMTQEQLARASGVAERTLSAFEAGERVPHKATLDAIQEALENRGIIFTNGDRPGVCLDRSKAIIST